MRLMLFRVNWWIVVASIKVRSTKKPRINTKQHEGTRRRGERRGSAESF